MPSERIRPLAICVFYREGRILVNESHDPIKGESFYRPLGGGIEFGETSAAAVEREIQEEIGASVTKLRLIGTLENIFTYLDAPGHEIVQVHDGQFVDQALYERHSFPGAESDGQPFEAIWQELESFSAQRPLYPDGLLALLQSKAVLLAPDA
jgi:8-oxo-dGTP pyrophosphatase MutT (NUDIX family)